MQSRTIFRKKDGVTTEEIIPVLNERIWKQLNQSELTTKFESSRRYIHFKNDAVIPVSDFESKCSIYNRNILYNNIWMNLSTVKEIVDK